MSNKRLKITHVARFAYPHIGGVEAVIEQINKCLPDDKFEKEVYCCSNTEKSSVDEGVKHVRCKYLFDFAANSISPHLFFKMMFLKTDIIHFHMPVIQNVVIWFILYHLGLLRYKKLIITYHGAIIGYDKYMKPFWGLYRYFFSKADKIHVLSPTIIDTDVILSSNREKCVVIPYGVNLDTPDLSNSETINGVDIKKFANNKKILLCVGRLVSLKGFDIAIQAIKDIDDAVLLIVGDGPEQKNYEEFIKTNSLEDKVKLLGFVQKKEKDYLFKSIDILLMTSTRTESFGIVQLEAMKYSKPVINTNLQTGMNYVSVDKETGLTVEPCSVSQLTSAIKMLCENDDLRMTLGNNARKRVKEKFDINKIKHEYQKLYNF